MQPAPALALVPKTITTSFLGGDKKILMAFRSATKCRRRLAAAI